jgi:hypothetical protein
MVEKWADRKEVNSFSGSGHIILPKDLVGRTVYVELDEDDSNEAGDTGE